ncbi:MAG TPA: ABC transporter ATP-binding protein [Shinella sp.]|uniref:ABC transporter ATP-binding protein n=1 Tax=Shinella sp. TaxID=1870904 RepID=UPI002E147FF9|nr:ABC transporter ATP-binding protein [Shinella sp.]
MSEISLSGISKFYGTFCAVRNVDLKVAQGELVTILGPSGSGKSTLLGLIAGLTTPSEGIISFGSRDVTHLPSRERNVGLVFQSYALFPHMTVFQNIAFPLKVRNYATLQIQAAVTKALQSVRLEHLSDRKPSQLSGGQQQRVALARGFVFEPDILLLDEPLGALDRKLREEVQVELRDLQRNLGITTVLVTHDQEEALSMSDRVMVLDQGEIRQIGTPEEVYLKPANSFVAGFLGTANVLSGTVRNLGGDWTMRLAKGLEVPCGPPPGPDQDVHCTMIIRPENLRLCSPDGHGPTGQVRDAIYLGQTTKHVVESEIGLIVSVGPSHERRSVGENVKLTWNRAATWFV